MKKLAVLVLSVALATGVGFAVFAQDSSGQQAVPGFFGRGAMPGGISWRLVLDQNGVLLSQEALAERLDAAVSSGIISAGERGMVQEMYERLKQQDGQGYVFGRGPDGFGLDCCGGFGRRGRR